MNVSDITNRLNLLKKEWDELVPAAKYSIIYSIIVLLFIWIDKTMDLNFFKSMLENPFKYTLQNSYFLLVNILIFTIFLILILERAYVNLKIIYYKIKYPIKNLNHKFYIISFQGRVCLLDINKKEIRWIKSWRTALDLDFIGEWTNVDVDITNPSMLVSTKFDTKDGQAIDLRDYKYVPGIHTQQAPGT